MPWGAWSKSLDHLAVTKTYLTITTHGGQMKDNERSFAFCPRLLLFTHLFVNRLYLEDAALL
jgi:hypothetical protein